MKNRTLRKACDETQITLWFFLEYLHNFRSLLLTPHVLLMGVAIALTILCPLKIRTPGPRWHFIFQPWGKGSVNLLQEVLPPFPRTSRRVIAVGCHRSRPATGCHVTCVDLAGTQPNLVMISATRPPLTSQPLSPLSLASCRGQEPGFDQWRSWLVKAGRSPNKHPFSLPKVQSPRGLPERDTYPEPSDAWLLHRELHSADLESMGLWGLLRTHSGSKPSCMALLTLRLWSCPIWAQHHPLCCVLLSQWRAG